MIETVKDWPNALVLVAALGVGGMLKTWLTHLRGKRKATDDVAMNLVGQLQARVLQLETGSQQERVMCDAKLGVLRHRLNNLSSGFDSLLMIYDIAPAKVQQAIAHIKERRREMETVEAIEKAAIAGIAAGGIDAATLAAVLADEAT